MRPISAVSSLSLPQAAEHLAQRDVLPILALQALRVFNKRWGLMLRRERNAKGRSRKSKAPRSQTALSLFIRDMIHGTKTP